MRAVAAFLTVVVLVAGCSGGDDDTSADPTTTTGGPTSTAAPEQFSGTIDDFYRVPDPLPEGEPGQLIRVQDLGEVGGYATVRVMYHSRDVEDRDRAVTGIVTYPTGPAPDGGWPVVSWSHGTTGLASKCAPSRGGAPAPAFGVEGVAVATDYIGLGPIGEIHPYLSKFAEGNAAIDAVRAARNLTAANAGTRWISIGHSQGGHAALAAAEQSTGYAPELDLLGTVAFAPGSDFSKVYGGIDPIVTRITGAMALFGAAGEHSDFDPADYAGPELEGVRDVIESECLDTIIASVAGIALSDGFYEQSPYDTEPAKSLMLANDVGDVKVEAPLLLASGTMDDRVVIDRVRSLFSRLCDAGQVTELIVVEGANHGDIMVRTADQVGGFLHARLAGAPPTDTCTDGGRR